MSVEEKVREIMAAAFAIPVERIGGMASTETIAEWDSVSHLSLVIGLEETYGVSLDPDDVPRMTDLGTILEILKKHGVGALGETGG